jgi:hypothetical protein
MKLTLIDDWQLVWHKLWSARLSLLAGVLGVIQSSFDYYTSGQPPVIVILMTVTAFAAFVARFVSQDVTNAEQ